MANAKTSMQSEIWNHLIDRSLKAGALATGSEISTRVNANDITAEDQFKELSSGAGTAKEAANQLRTLIKQVSDFSDTGSGALIGIFNALPEFQTCMGPQTDIGTQVIGATIGMAASFAAGGSATGRNVRGVVTKFAEFVRDSRISGVFREGNAKEYWNSMSCLIESAQQTFCATQDTQRMLDWMRDEQEFRESKKALAEGKIAGPAHPADDSKRRNPLDGYYLLVNHVPEVSRWIQRVMFGSDPRMKLEADFQNRVISDVQGLVYAEKNVRGLIGSYKQAVDGAVDKKSAVLNLVNRIVMAMQQGGEGREEVNFIVRAIPLQSLPYVIVGYEKSDLPSDAKATTGGFIPFDDWAQGAVADGRQRGPRRPPGASRPTDDEFDPNAQTDNSIKWNSKFDDPDALLNTIEGQVTKIFRDAQLDSIRYFTKMLIVDKPSIIIESIANPVRNVPEALRQIIYYLDNLKATIEKLSDEKDLAQVKVRGKLMGVSKAAMIPFIEDTSVRIMAVLAAYDGLETYYESNKDSFQNIRSLLQKANAYSLVTEQAKTIMTKGLKKLLGQITDPSLNGKLVTELVKKELAEIITQIKAIPKMNNDLAQLIAKDFAGIESNLPITAPDPKLLEEMINKEFSAISSAAAKLPQASPLTDLPSKLMKGFKETAGKISALKERTAKNVNDAIRAGFQELISDIGSPEHPTNEIADFLNKRMSVITSLVPALLQEYDRVDEYLVKEFELTSKRAEASAPAVVAMEDFLVGVQEAAGKVVTTAYDRFNILLQRDTFLTTRLSNLVKLDYSLRVRNSEFDHLDAQDKQLLLASSRNLIDYFYGITSENPTKLESDLARAQDINMGNMENLEAFFTPSIHAFLREKKMRLEGKRPTNSDLNAAATADWREAHSFTPRNSWFGKLNEKMDQIWYKYVVGTFWPALAPVSPADAERFQMHQGANNVRGLDDEQKSMERDYTLMCIQTLSFVNREQFKPYCEGRILKSYYSDRHLPKVAQELDVSWDQVLKETPTDPKIKIQSDAFYSNGVCALRDFYRASDVRWMTKHLKAFSDIEFDSIKVGE